MKKIAIIAAVVSLLAGCAGKSAPIDTGSAQVTTASSSHHDYKGENK
jgi:outer membrane murein-binding lipoprotein Lpp